MLSALSCSQSLRSGSFLDTRGSSCLCHVFPQPEPVEHSSVRTGGASLADAVRPRMARWLDVRAAREKCRQIPAILLACAVEVTPA